MWNETIETRGHTSKDGTLNLTVNVGAADAEVEVTLHVRPDNPSDQIDANGWPVDFFERVAGRCLIWNVRSRRAHVVLS